MTNLLAIKRKFSVYAIIFFISTISHNLYAAVYTVSNASQISTVMSSALPGDTIKMTDGIWTDQVINFGGANGTALAPIVLIAQTIGSVYLEGSSRIRIYGNYLVVNGLTFRNPTPSLLTTNHIIEFRNGSTLANYCRVTNMFIDKYNSANNVDNKWVSIYGTNNKVDHCKFDGKSNYGPVLVVWYQSVGGFPNESPTTNHLIEYNYFLNRTLPLGGNGGETIRIGDSQTSRTDGYNLIQYNLFEHCDGEIEIISNKSEYNTYRFNTFRESNGQLTLRHGAFCTVEGNFFLGNGYAGSSGVRLIDSSHIVKNNYFENLTGGNVGSLRAPITFMNGDLSPAPNGYWPVKNCKIVNNSFINCTAYTMNIGIDSDVPPENCEITNNIFYGNSGPFIRNTTNPINFQYSNNIYYGAGLGISTTGFTNVDPLLDNSGSSNLYRLTSSSPAIDGGLLLVNLMDMDGQQRISIPDVGADEYSSSQILIRPLTSVDVGPCWLGNSMPCASIALALNDISMSYVKLGNTLKIIVKNSSGTGDLFLQKYNYNLNKWDFLADFTFDQSNQFFYYDENTAIGLNTYRVLRKDDHNMLAQLNYKSEAEISYFSIIDSNIIFQFDKLKSDDRIIIFDQNGGKVFEVMPDRVGSNNFDTSNLPTFAILCLYRNGLIIQSDVIKCRN